MGIDLGSQLQEENAENSAFGFHPSGQAVTQTKDAVVSETGSVNLCLANSVPCCKIGSHSYSTLHDAFLGLEIGETSSEFIVLHLYFGTTLSIYYGQVVQPPVTLSGFYNS